MASPLEVVVDIAPVVAGTSSALGALIYLVRRMWNIDLELRTSREEHRAAYYEAKEHAEVARERGAKRVWGREISDLGEESRFLPEPGRVGAWLAQEGILVDWDELDWI